MPRRGEIWWVRLDPTVGSEIQKTRPCIVLTANVQNQQRRTAVVIPLSTSSQINPPLMVPVMCAGRHAVAVIDQIRAVSKARLDRRIGALAAEELAAVEAALGDVLEL